MSFPAAGQPRFPESAGSCGKADTAGNGKNKGNNLFHNGMKNIPARKESQAVFNRVVQ
jgi:hypothetical protein